MGRMTGEDEVGGGRQHVEAKLVESAVEPLAAFDHADTALLKIGLVLKRSDGAGLGGPAKRVRVEAVLHPGERLDQVGIADRIAHPQTRQAPGVLPWLPRQKVRVRGDQRYSGLG